MTVFVTSSLAWVLSLPLNNAQPDIFFLSCEGGWLETQKSSRFSRAPTSEESIPIGALSERSELQEKARKEKQCIT